MTFIKKFYKQAKAFCIAYPAVLSGFVIYSYLFYCILQYFFKVKSYNMIQSHAVKNILESFDAFPFMWLLSVALVKVIEIRTKLHESEAQRLVIEREMQLKHTQLKTLQEVTRGVQHHINNPLAIISLSIRPIQKAADNNPEILHHLNVVEEAVNRITTALNDFSKVSDYTVESAGPIVGDIVMPNIPK
jgi:signal transduction histidine kinase